MKKKFLSVLFVCMVSVLAGCQINWKTEETVQAPQQVVKTEVETGANLLKTTKTDDQRSASTGSEILSETNKIGVEIKNSEVFSHGEKRGWIEGNRIFINFENNVYSFEFDGDVDKLKIPNRITYNGVF